MGSIEFPIGVAPIPMGKMLLVNHNPYNLKQKEHSLVSTKKGEIT